ncbi:MAG: gamma-glutamyltransferase, partial [Deltaproteobacteria bacterium]|nr:gamma-glutamyltransferase [Deltaproteobacteria bacterium]
MRIVIMAMAVCLAGCGTQKKSDTEDYLKMEKPETEKPETEKPQGAVASRGMLTGTTGAYAQEAGLEILKAGGTAADAAMATSLAQIGLAAGSWVSYAGILTLVYYDAESGKVYNMNAAYNTVKNETEPQTIPQPDWSKGLMGVETEPNGRTVLVPGFMKGVEAANRRFGKLPLKKVFEPTIRLVEEGFEWNAGLAAQFKFREKVLTRDPETRAVFTKADGSFYQPGDTFKQPALAETLKKIAEQGTDYMYKGAWAEKLVKKVQALGGKLTLADMAAYDVIWGEPDHGTYHGYDVYVHGQPAFGGVNTIEALNLAEAAGLSGMGHYAESPEALFRLPQVFKVAASTMFGADAVANALEMDFSPQTRLTKTHAAKLWKVMDSGSFPGVIVSKKQMPAHSDAVVAVDQWGNVASVVHSINTVSWGTTGLVIDGISIPDSAMIQVPVVAATPPGERLPDPTNPGLVMKDGKPFMGFSAIGAGLHNRTIACLINVLDFGMTPQEAVNAPAFGSFKMEVVDGAPALGALTVGVKDFDPELIEKVKEMGQEIIEDRMMLGYWIG